VNNETRIDDTATAGQAAAELTAVGESLAAAWNSAKAQIEGLNTPATWGADKAGRNFEANYLKDAQSLLERGTEQVATMVVLGPTVQEALAGTVSADDMSARLFEKLNASYK